MGVRTGSPQTALEAVTWRRLLVSGWPWRSAGYLLSGLPVAAVAFVTLAIPWLVLVARLTAGGAQVGTVVALVLFGAALVGALGPLIAAPVAAVERRRLRMVDIRPVAHRHRHAMFDGPVSWLRARYADPAVWREVGYVCMLATVAPVLAIAGLLTVPLTVTFVASSFLVLAQRPGGDPVALGVGQAASVGQTLPYVIAGVVLLPVVPYLLTLLAGGQCWPWIGGVSMASMRLVLR
jgi:Putative sensor